MESWDEHQVTFEPAEGLENNETSIRVLDQEQFPAIQKQKQDVQTLIIFDEIQLKLIYVDYCVLKIIVFLYFNYI